MLKGIFGKVKFFVEFFCEILRMIFKGLDYTATCGTIKLPSISGFTVLSGPGDKKINAWELLSQGKKEPGVPWVPSKGSTYTPALCFHSGSLRVLRL